MSEHTQGEWSVDLMEGYEEGTDLYVLDSDGFPIATIEASPILHNWHERYPDMPHWADGADDGRTQKFRSEEETIANALLLGAASAMLKALDRVYSELGMRSRPSPECQEEIRAAIAKARGEV